MTHSKIQIGTSDGLILDTFKHYGLIHIDSDKYVYAPIKQYVTTQYAEEEGEHIYPKSVDAAFDYKITFLVLAPNRDLECANAKIRAFNEELCDVDSNGVKTFRQVAFWNFYRHVKIVGYPQSISEADSFYRRPNGEVEDAVKVTFTIRVNKPSLCDWNVLGINYMHEIMRTRDMQPTSISGYVTNDSIYWLPEELDLSKVVETSNAFSRTSLVAFDADLANCTQAMALVSQNPELLSINLQNTSNIKYWASFSWDTPKLLCITGVDYSSFVRVRDYNTGVGEGDIFTKWGEESLTRLEIKNLGKSDCTFYSFTSASHWGEGSKRALDSLVNTLLRDSYDRASANMPTARIRLHPNAMARLTTEQLDAIRAKGYIFYGDTGYNED